MKLQSLVLIAAIAFFVLSCGKTEQQAETIETTQEEGVSEETEQAETLTATLERDPRTIGTDKSKEQYKIEENIYEINASENPLYGFWVGSFGKNKINIALAHVDKDSIFGHSVCAGNFRPIKGSLKESHPGVYDIQMKEPGDDQYDGEFKFTIDLSKKELTGSWKPYKNTVSAKEYTLKKRIYKYDARLGDYPDASTRYLEESDVENLLPEEIEMIRNEIYARHGYSFQNLRIRRIFDAKDWYIPMCIDIRDQLTEVEAHNIILLYNYEEYYDDYYDSYGR
ncbi:YARHG domain-containing protein [Fulvivirga sp. 29W222]|uniref:YARHG domain-containing protein n=1 Tax=Fulvivirga marina TaxID=2494733 RepID=A0A937FW19_9BACT|nr:YARHG domain-containing protein [Fulvivirga marina]MBL6445538.1 YARHG domain-containing protein [Fulvivirga marina]